ncbi:MAG: hypothetical protein DI622_03390 [Chryseobacterium sp.]|uniref:hypothetical protein n=1 Tax=Chryseobacterium sp. TaxID=1871047 RepID=UPI000DAFB005|nr:hypothetical protein [Chryseobacterium sp.]MPS63695.1 hypothetical protein [Chryseobacterium sp.]PZU24854.1 MAG: hypothetical protein DI622_03390 [Chryseobacterium sp.]
MKKSWVKKFLIATAILLGIVLLANFGFNFWLKNKLPDYIKKNTDYKVSYKTLDVDLTTGNIFVTGITVNNKNPQNTEVIGLQGTIDTLKISRFGIFDAVFNKRISSTDLLLGNPNLNIILSKPVDEKTGKKKNPVMFENIRIHKGEITIFRYTRQPFLKIEELDLYVENLQMTEESVENKLPVVFDSYSIKGKNFFFRPDNIYALRIDKITTSNGQMSVENFRLDPLVTFDQFKQSYPQKKQLFQFSIPKMDFKDVILKKNIISLSQAFFYHPNLTVYTNSATKPSNKKPFNFEVDLNGVKMDHATVQIIKPDGNKLFSAKELNLNINELKFSKDTSEETIPIRYSDFNITGKDIAYFNAEHIICESFGLNPKKGEFRNIAITSPETATNLKLNQLAVTINKWETIDKKLNLEINEILVDRVNGVFKAQEKKKTVPKKGEIKGIQFPLTINKVTVKNSNVVYDKGNQPLKFNDLNASLNHLEIKQKFDGTGLGVDVKNYLFSTKNFTYKTKFYNMSVANVEFGNNKVKIDQFAMKPLVSRAQFIKMIPVERDLYDITAKQITAAGNWNLFSQNKFINASNVNIQSADANIFRSKIPKDDPKEKALYSKMLRSIKFPLQIHNLDVKKSVLVYEEDTPESAGPGKLTFSNFNMNVKNLNSAKTKGKPTRVDIKINCSFMNLSPLAVNWNFDVANSNDVFAISGRTTNLPVQGINPFIRPYLHVTATSGTIHEMFFNFKGNPKGINGNFNLKHKDLKIAILDKKNHEKKGVLTAVANLFIKSDSGKFPEEVTVENVERDPTKSFFNLFWRGIEDGLKKTLIGRNVDKTETTVKKAVSAVKDMKSSVNELKQEVKNAKDQKQHDDAQPKKKKGFFKNVFKKKETPETE